MLYLHSIIADIISDVWGRQVLISIENIQHGKNILKIFYERFDKDRLDKISFVHDKSVTRTEDITNFTSCKLKVLIATRILNQSVTFPELSVLINAAGRKAFVEVIQRSGRPLGKSATGEKKNVKIYDIVDKHNRYLYRHAIERAKLYEGEAFPQTGLEKFN